MIPIVSFIIPVYNSEKYLLRCINSILAQPFQNFEIILVNDGSTDKSGIICDECVVRDSRIRSFHKGNGGVSSARNLGIDKAQGTYISFIDSDDWLDNDSIPSSLFVKEFDVIQIPRNRGSFFKTYYNDVVCISREETVSFLDNNYYNECWGRFYKRQVIGHHRFDENIRMGEDLLFLVKIYNNINTYFVLGGNNGYHYFDNDESASATLGYFTDLDELTEILYTAAKKENNRLAWRFLLVLCGIHHKNRGTYKQFVSKFGYYELWKAPVDKTISRQIMSERRQFIKQNILCCFKKLLRRYEGELQDKV